MKNKNIELINKKILVTGATGFIGSNLVKKLLELYGAMTIIGLDNLSDYYDVALKDYWLEQTDKLCEKQLEKTGYFLKGVFQIKSLLMEFLNIIILKLLLI